MCQACLEAELWLAYQEDLAARETAAAAAAASVATPSAADSAAPAKPQTPPDRPAASFACEEPPST